MDTQPDIAVIDYGAGNVRSVLFALGRLGLPEDSFVLTSSPQLIAGAKAVIFPGQGEATNTMANLHQTGLAKLIPTLRQPVLGICIGQQLLCAHTTEGGGVDCLGVFPMLVEKFAASPTGHAGAPLKVPQVGWNKLTGCKGPLVEGLDGQYAYFVHSYYVPASDYDIARADYGIGFSAAIARDNFHAVQFHPEKSGPLGQEIIRRFLRISDLPHAN